MPDEEDDSAWDEFDWELYMRDQERRTEEFMELLERYQDHPDRDALIAREMGWFEEEADATSPEAAREAWNSEHPSRESSGDEAATEAAGCEPADAHGTHPLCRLCREFVVFLRDLLDDDRALESDPDAGRLMALAMSASAKMAAALESGPDAGIGMLVAYLKRALKSFNDSLAILALLRDRGLVSGPEYDDLIARVFSLRDSVIVIMGDARAAQRRGADNFPPIE